MADSITDIYVLQKRLEILKTVIALQDMEDIAIQTKKFEEVTAELEDLELVMETAWITDLLNKASYGDAMQQIHKLLLRFKALTMETAPEVEGLRTEVAALTAQINGVETQLTAVEHTICQFEIQQTQEIGEIALKVLTFKRRKATSKAAQLSDDPAAQKEMEDAESEEKSYRGAYEQKLARLLNPLTDDEVKEQNMMFKKIAKLTHPDLVDKRYEMEAVALFRQAKEAKDTNDIATIKKIYEYLTSGTPFVHEHITVSEIDGLRNEVKYLRRLLDVNAQKLSALQLSDNYQSILNIDNWQTYFAGVKAKMMADLNQLEAV